MGWRSANGCRIDDDLPLEENFGFQYVVGSNDEGLARFLQLFAVIPKNVLAVDIYAQGRFVEQDDVGVVEQGAGEDETALHPAGELILDFFVPNLGQSGFDLRC